MKEDSIELSDHYYEEKKLFYEDLAVKIYSFFMGIHFQSKNTIVIETRRFVRTFERLSPSL